jgi:hypothetical protein
METVCDSHPNGAFYIVVEGVERAVRSGWWVSFIGGRPLPGGNGRWWAIVSRKGRR